MNDIATTYITRILMVDDHPENLLALKALLDDPGYECVSAGSGREALTILLADQNFSVILLDVQMPDMDGYETARLIQGREKTRNIPIIFITAAYTSLAHILHGYDVKAADYIVKPIEPQLLRRRIAVFAELHHKTEMAMRELGNLKSIVAIGCTDTGSKTAEVPLATDELNRLVDSYITIFNAYAYEQCYKSGNKHTALLNAFAKRLGECRATPRDLIRIHLAAIQRLSQRNKSKSTNGYVEAGRLLLLEMIGHLATYYRSLALAE